MWSCRTLAEPDVGDDERRSSSIPLECSVSYVILCDVVKSHCATQWSGGSDYALPLSSRYTICWKKHRKPRRDGRLKNLTVRIYALQDTTDLVTNNFRGLSSLLLMISERVALEKSTCGTLGASSQHSWISIPLSGSPNHATGTDMHGVCGNDKLHCCKEDETSPYAHTHTTRGHETRMQRKTPRTTRVLSLCIRYGKLDDLYLFLCTFEQALVYKNEEYGESLNDA